MDRYLRKKFREAEIGGLQEKDEALAAAKRVLEGPSTDSLDQVLDSLEAREAALMPALVALHEDPYLRRFASSYLDRYNQVITFLDDEGDGQLGFAMYGFYDCTVEGSEDYVVQNGRLVLGNGTTLLENHPRVTISGIKGEFEFDIKESPEYAAMLKDEQAEDVDLDTLVTKMKSREKRPRH